MISPRSSQKIKSLINDLAYGVKNQPANKIIHKFYDLATRIDQQFSRQKQAGKIYWDVSKYNTEQDLQKLEDLFSVFEKTRSDQINKFNQAQHYMFQQTKNIISKHQKPIVKFVFDAFKSISEFFLKPEKYHYPTEPEDTEGSSDQIIQKLSQPKNLGNQKFTFQQCQHLWQKVLQYYQDHRLDQAYSKAQKFLYLMNLIDKGNQLSISQKSLIQTINNEYKVMTQFYDHFYDTGYTFDKEETGISLWYKIIGKKDVAIKVSAQVDITIQNFLCIASQIDLFGDYIPFTYDTKQLKLISRNQKIGTSKIYIPLLTDRETYFYAAAYDRLRTKGSIFFFSKTINEDLDYQKRYSFEVPKNTQLIRLEYKYYILQYVPITKTRGKINMVSSIDLKMDYLPLFIINKSARIFSYDYMRNYDRINKKFQGSKWDKMKKQKKQLYDYFQTKIDQYLNQKQGQK